MALLFVLWGCGASQDTLPSEYPSVYTNKQLEVSPEVKVYHISADSSMVYIAINTDNLLYTKVKSAEFTAEAQITITPENSMATAETAEGKILVLSDEDPKKQKKRIMAQTQLYLPAGTLYTLRFNIEDANTGKHTTIYRRTDKRTEGLRDYFMCRPTESMIPLFGDRISPLGDYRIQTSVETADKLFVNYYERDFPFPPPPFARYDPPRFDYRPDSSFELGLDEDKSTQFEGVHTGFYHFRTDTTSKEGLTLHVSSPGFPKITTTEELLGPIRYLLSSKEYAALLEADNPKAVMESYWLDWAGNKDRARRNIETYYGRVEEANKHFSCHVDGWKSDRGLIYIVFGKPTKAYRRNNLEKWVYGEENNPLSVNFTFVKVINPFSDNDYRLEREEQYKPTWYRAIDTWRSGRAF